MLKDFVSFPEPERNPTQEVAPKIEQYLPCLTELFARAPTRADRQQRPQNDWLHLAEELLQHANRNNAPKADPFQEERLPNIFRGRQAPDLNDQARTGNFWGRSQGRKDGFHYRMDPNDGEIRLFPNVETLEINSRRHAWIWRGSNYRVNPNTGERELSPNIETLVYRFNPNKPRGSHYDVNPNTGKIELLPDIQPLSYKVAMGKTSSRFGFNYDV